MDMFFLNGKVGMNVVGGLGNLLRDVEVYSVIWFIFGEKYCFCFINSGFGVIFVVFIDDYEFIVIVNDFVFIWFYIIDCLVIVVG